MARADRYREEDEKKRQKELRRKEKQKRRDNRKRRRKGKAAVLILIVMLLLVFCAAFVYYLSVEFWYVNSYAAGDRAEVALYTIDDGKPVESGSITRGKLVRKYLKPVRSGEDLFYRTETEDAVTNARISRVADNPAVNIYENFRLRFDAEGMKVFSDVPDVYRELFGRIVRKVREIAGRSADDEAENTFTYMKDGNLSETGEGIVQEQKVYVRTPATIYEKAEGPDIASFAAKGSTLRVTGYDKLLDDGEVKKYRVEYKEPDEDEAAGSTAEGYVYRKYTVRSKKEARAVYNENGIHDAAAKDNYSFKLYGGKAANLDYYPFERSEIEGKEFCDNAKAMYINGVAAVNPSSYVKIIKKTECNAVVIDIKDGYLAYKSDVARELSPSSYDSAYSSRKKYLKGVDAYRDTGAYLIGRIVVFNDPLYARDHPKDCIKYGRNTGWPSAYSRNVWEYNVKLAIEAVKEFGFDEIQFDYVRFPENSYEMSRSGKADFRNKYGEEKGQAVQNFCMYAADQIHEAGAYFSVDVFGESAYGYMTAYGQYWPGISNIVDAISAMPYTDHMGVDDSWKHPYRTMLTWSKKAKAQQDKLESPAAARTWITGYNTPHWNPTVNYNAKKMNDQIRALEKAGLTGGFIPWNAASDIGKYKEYKSIWN